MAANHEKLRTLKSKVEADSKTIERIVEQIIGRYCRELDEFVSDLRERLNDEREVSTDELERYIFKLPILMYFSATGLENLGIEGETAKAQKMEAFNRAYIDAEGTIQDKTKQSELETFNEHLIEVCFSRAYKKLKLNLEMAEHIFSGLKKIISKRISEDDLTKGER